MKNTSSSESMCVMTHVGNGNQFMTQAVLINTATFGTLTIVKDCELSAEHVGPNTTSQSSLSLCACGCVNSTAFS